MPICKIYAIYIAYKYIYIYVRRLRAGLLCQGVSAVRPLLVLHQHLSLRRSPITGRHESRSSRACVPVPRDPFTWCHCACLICEPELLPAGMPVQLVVGERHPSAIVWAG